jgi:hypothetical protein
MNEKQAVRAGCVFNAALFPFVLAAFFFAQKRGVGGGVLLGALTAQLFSVSYFLSLLLLKFLPGSMMMLPVFGGFFVRMVVLAAVVVTGQIFFPGTVPYFAMSFGAVTFITLMAETVILVRVSMR